MGLITSLLTEKSGQGARALNRAYNKHIDIDTDPYVRALLPKNNYMTKYERRLEENER